MFYPYYGDTMLLMDFKNPVKDDSFFVLGLSAP